MKNSEKKSEISDIIKARREKILDRRGWTSLLLRILGLALVFWLLFSQFFIFSQLSGNGMYPALKDGDLLIGFRITDRYKSGDVVIYRMDGRNCAGRVVATGGDYVQLDETGQLRVNGTLQSGEIMYPSFPREGTEYPVFVPEGSVFVMGDYRTQCTDSRDFGPLPEAEIQGRLISFLRRRGF
jgi:signal peptidase I